MNTIKAEYATLVRELLEEIYTRKRETGKTSNKVQAYVRGFFDAGLHLGLITEEALNNIIEDINIQIFGRSMKKQKEMFQEIHQEYDDYIDVPAFFRKGKFFLMSNDDS